MFCFTTQSNRNKTFEKPRTMPWMRLWNTGLNFRVILSLFLLLKKRKFLQCQQKLNCHASLKFVIFCAAYETEGIFSLFWAKVGLKRSWQWALCLFNDWIVLERLYHSQIWSFYLVYCFSFWQWSIFYYILNLAAKPLPAQSNYFTDTFLLPLLSKNR